jgi:hypothetical protein
MRPAFRPRVENLEMLSLLSGAAPIAAIGDPALTLKLTTDRATYQPGQTVTMTLTETNTSGHDLRIVDGPSTDGFYVTRNGVTVWTSNAGPQPLYLRLITLHPGESIRLRAIWDDRPNTPSDPFPMPAGAPVTGMLEVHSQVHQQSASAAPVTILVGPTATVQPLAVTVTTNHASYLLKQPVTITITERNTSDKDVLVSTGCQILSGSATGPLGPVWVYRDPRDCVTGRMVLHAGQSRQLTFGWNGLPDLPHAHAVRGWYVIRAGVDGTSNVAVIRIR